MAPPPNTCVRKRREVREPFLLETSELRNGALKASEKKTNDDLTCSTMQFYIKFDDINRKC